MIQENFLYLFAPEFVSQTDPAPDTQKETNQFVNQTFAQASLQAFLYIRGSWASCTPICNLLGNLAVLLGNFKIVTIIWTWKNEDDNRFFVLILKIPNLSLNMKSDQNSVMIA